MIKHASECPCQYRHLETWRPHTHGTNDTKPRMLPHTASPPFSANRQPSLTHIDTPPSLPHSRKRREPVKDARRQHADRVVLQVELPGTTEEAVSPHTLHQHMPAVSISMHMHVPHAHAPCTCTCAPCVCVCVGGWVLCVCVCV